MRILIQRVVSATVRKVVPLLDKPSGMKDPGKVKLQKQSSSIGRGLLLFVGIGKEDNKEVVEYLANKIYRLRIFENEGKFDYSLADINGEVLIVSQFTLYARTDKGRRPEFTEAESPKRAREIFEYFYNCLSKLVPCKKGFFGEKMEVELINEGPVTLILEK